MLAWNDLTQNELNSYFSLNVPKELASSSILSFNFSLWSYCKTSCVTVCRVESIRIKTQPAANQETLQWFSLGEKNDDFREEKKEKKLIRFVSAWIECLQWLKRVTCTSSVTGSRPVASIPGFSQTALEVFVVVVCSIFLRFGLKGDSRIRDSAEISTNQTWVPKPTCLMPSHHRERQSFVIPKTCRRSRRKTKRRSILASRSCWSCCAIWRANCRPEMLLLLF